jgi:fatty-acid desaturase
MSSSSNSKLAPLMPPELGRLRFDAGKTLWLWGMALPGVLLGVPSLTATTTVTSLALAFVTLCLGHSVGLHRGIIHGSYRAHPITRGALAYLAVLSGLGGPLSWVRTHAVRDYWQSRSDCPRYFAYDHSLLADFAWNLHLRFEPADDRADARLPPGVSGDRWLRFLERSWPLHIAALAAAIALLLGPAAVASCVCARTAAGIVGHQVVTYAGHTWGAPRVVIPGAKESGRNVWLLGVLSFGEGFHNNHHAFPGSARMGMRRHELDLGWCALWLLERVGLVRDLVAWHRPAPRRARPPATSSWACARRSRCS